MMRGISGVAHKHLSHKCQSVHNSRYLPWGIQRIIMLRKFAYLVFSAIIRRTPLPNYFEVLYLVFLYEIPDIRVFANMLSLALAYFSNPKTQSIYHCFFSVAADFGEKFYCLCLHPISLLIELWAEQISIFSLRFRGFKFWVCVSCRYLVIISFQGVLSAWCFWFWWHIKQKHWTKSSRTYSTGATVSPVH